MEYPLIYIVTILGIVAMTISAIPRNKFKYNLEAAWLLIFAFLAIRYDFGNDYMSYFDSFSWGVSFDDELGVYRESRDLEFGWQLLCKLLHPIGFFAFVALLTAFECYVFYMFTKKYVAERYYWLAIFIFIFNPSIMLIGSSAMRQMLAIAIFVNSIKYIEQRRLLPYVISIFIASQFHTSASILYPLYLVAFYNGRSITVNIMIVVVYILLLLSTEYMKEIIDHVATIAGEEEAVDYYLENAIFQKDGSGLGNLLKILTISYMALTLHTRNRNILTPFMLLIAGSFVHPFSSIIPMIGRFGYYFGACSMACYPSLLKDDIVHGTEGLSAKRITSSIVLLMVIVVTIFEYISFFANPIWIEKFSSYHTIFEAL